MKIAVTGGSGFIGSHVMRILAAGGHQSVNVDRRDPHFPCELSNRSMLASLIRGAESIVHCAARADVRHNWDPGQIAKLVEENESATGTLLEVAASIGTVKRFVFTSTGAIYAKCMSPYAASKMSGESWTWAYATKMGWLATVVRPAACYGTGYHHGHVADFVTMARTKGAIISLTDGRPRDGLHAEDCASWLARFAATVEPKHEKTYYLRSTDRWGCRDTAKLIGVPAQWGDGPTGWIGDTDTRRPSDLPCGRSVESGVRQSLVSLGWVAQC